MTTGALAHPVFGPGTSGANILSCYLCYDSRLLVLVCYPCHDSRLLLLLCQGGFQRRSYTERKVMQSLLQGVLFLCAQHGCLQSLPGVPYTPVMLLLQLHP